VVGGWRSGEPAADSRLIVDEVKAMMTGESRPVTNHQPPATNHAPFVLVSGDFVKHGGMDRANHALAAYLLAQGREVHLVAHRVDEDLLARPGAVFHRAPKPLNSYLLGQPLLSHHGRRWARRLGAGGARVVVNGGNCRWGDVNWVHYVHAAWTPRTTGTGLRPRRLKAAVAHRQALADERACLARARVVVANSERTRADLIDRLGVPGDRVRMVYYGVDPEQFRPPTGAERAGAKARLGWDDGRPVVAFVGALGDLRKGFDTLLDAWARLAKAPGSGSGWDARLAVVGAGALRSHWEAEAGRRGLLGSVEFLGFRPDVPMVLRASDVLVSPVRYEAYGLNVHEALCCGLPALVSRGAGVAERYPEALRDLLLPDAEDAADLAARLVLWRDRREALAAEAAALSKALRAYTWEDMAARIVTAAEEAS
jgi:glycosyltransferase involved in cell wall biosynthesis